MSKDLSSHETPDITVEACAWIAQLETGALTAADVDAFREWMRRSSRHAAEIRRLAKVSMDLNVLTEIAGPLQEAAAHYRPITKEPARRRFGFHALGLGALAAAAAVAVTVAYFLAPAEIAPSQPMQVATAMGGYREITLSDGTLVKLNTDSRIEVDYTREERKVRLLAGEAFFDVTPDPDRSFVVQANGKSVRAVGTAFVVRLLEEKIEVTVVEGRVELTDTTATAGEKGRGEDEIAESRGLSSATPPAPIILQTGQSLSIPAKKRERTLLTLSSRELQRQLSWQEGLHDFSNTPLEEVIREVSRYSPVEIEIADPELREIEFGGLFRVGETRPLFDALQKSFGIKVEYVDDNKVRLSLAPE
jgi:transmembrane sensor